MEGTLIEDHDDLEKYVHCSKLQYLLRLEVNSGGDISEGSYESNMAQALASCGRNVSSSEPADRTSPFGLPGRLLAPDSGSASSSTC